MTSTHQVHHIILDNTEHLKDRFGVNMVNMIICNIHMIAIFSSACCMNMIAVEQHLATIWVDNYEKKTYVVGCILMAIVVSKIVL